MDPVPCTDRDAVWNAEPCWSRKPCIRWWCTLMPPGECDWTARV